MQENSSIVLLGPMGVGKSTVGELLAKATNKPYVHLDDVAWDYFKEVGYDGEYVRDTLLPTLGYAGLLPYMKPFEAHAVERVINEHPDSVLDFGAGHALQDDDLLAEKVKNALAPVKNVVLLMPSPDVEKSKLVLHHRMVKRVEELGEWYAWALDENVKFITHPAHELLAKITVYTEGKAPAAVCAEIGQACGYDT